mgnify:FL=1
MTIDLPVLGVRYRNYQLGSFSKPLTGKVRRSFQGCLRPYWAWYVGICGRPPTLGNRESFISTEGGMGDYMKWVEDNFDDSFTWSDLDFI